MPEITAAGGILIGLAIVVVCVINFAVLAPLRSHRRPPPFD